MQIFSIHPMPGVGGIWPAVAAGNLHDELGRAVALLLDDLVLSEVLGFDGVVLPERHTIRQHPMPSAALVAAVASGRLRRARIILHGLALSLTYPHRTAEEIGFLDLLAKGRIEASFSHGEGPDYWTAPVNPANGREIFLESLDLIVKGWRAGTPLRHEGEFYSYKYYNPLPPPADADAIRLSLADGDAWLIEEAQARQLPVMSLLKSRIRQTEVAASAGAGIDRWISAYVHVGSDQTTAEAEARSSLETIANPSSTATLAMLIPPGLMSVEDYRARLAAAQSLPAIIVGDPQRVADELAGWIAEARATRLGVCFRFGRMHEEPARVSMQRFVEMVVPRLGIERKVS